MPREKPMPDVKLCRKCGETKPLDEFRRRSDGHTKDGRMARCSACFLVREANYRKIHPLRWDAAQKARSDRWRKENMERLYAAHRLQRQRRMLRDPKGCRLKSQRANMRRRALQMHAGGTVLQNDLDKVLRRYGGRCAYCLKRPANTWDHVIPLRRGGLHTIGNLLPACRQCNSSKGVKFLAQWRFSKHA